MTEKLWFDSDRSRRYFSSPKHPYWLWGLPPSHSMGTGALSPGDKMAGAG